MYFTGQELCGSGVPELGDRGHPRPGHPQAPGRFTILPSTVLRAGLAPLGI